MYDCIIIGAGPAGLMCRAILSDKNKVLVLEKNNVPGKKLLLTGGGRCNITNLKESNTFLEIVDYNKKYLYSSINRFGPQEIFDFFQNQGVELKIEEDDKVFPKSNKAKDILNALLNAGNIHQINYNEEVLKIETGNIKKITTNKSVYTCKNLIVASGGSSYPITGSTGDNLLFAEMLSQPVVEIFPADTGVILEEDLDLAGTTIDSVIISHGKLKKTGNLMFTHKGLSGSAIMKISEFIYKSTSKTINIDLVPNLEFNEFIDNLEKYSELNLEIFLEKYFTKRFSKFLVKKLNLQKFIKSLSKNEITKVFNLIKNYSLEVKAVNDIDKAYVTGGGMDLNYVNTSTFESKINPGIYFIGEALDVHGPVGGYNLTLALSTAYSAAKNIEKGASL